MGYELHIVRNDDWLREQVDGGISLAEWSATVASDDSMRMDGFAEVESDDGSTLRVENEGLAVWVDYIGNQDGGNQAWFDFRSNAIVVKNPDQEILAKMLDIAAKLGAKIIGEEGEEYTSPTDHGIMDRATLQEFLAAQSKPWWKFW